MTNSSQHYCLRWNNHIANFVSVVSTLLKTESFTDVTIAVDDGTTLKCHKIVLAACSSYFQDLFLKNPCEHPTVILSGVKYGQIRAILEYMYRGEVNVVYEELDSLIKVANFLKVKGLEMSEPESEPEREPTPRSLPMLASVAAAQAMSNSNNNNSTSNNNHGSAMSNGYASPPPPPHVAAPFSMPFGKTPMDPHSAMGLWPALIGLQMHPQHPISGHQPPPRSSFLAGSYDGITDSSPLSRKKLSSYMANRDTPILRNVLGGQNDASPNERHETYSNHSNGSVHDSDRRNSSELSETMAEDDEMKTTPHKYCTPGSQQKDVKPEWKRYKQYTRQHIMDAMAAVSNKEMSALQAASKFGIPSRTLYDKLKKAGILPTRGAGIQRASRSSESASVGLVGLHAGSARFPYSSSMNGSVYGTGGNGLSESEGETNGQANGCYPPESPTSLVMPANGLARAASVDMDTDAQNNGGPASSSGNEDGAEDLSVGSRRSSDHSVIVPPEVAKQEDEASMQHDDES